MIWNKAVEWDIEHAFFLPLSSLPLVFVTVIGLGTLFFGVTPDPLDPAMNVLVWNPSGYPWWGILISIVALTEFFFWLDKSKPSDENVMWFTVERKASAFADGMFALGVFGCAYWGIQRLGEPAFWGLLSSISIATITVLITAGALYGYVWINARRYKEANDHE